MRYFFCKQTWCVLYFGSLDKEVEVDEKLSAGILRFRLRGACCCGKPTVISNCLHVVMYGRTHLKEVNAEEMATQMDTVLKMCEI